MRDDVVQRARLADAADPLPCRPSRRRPSMTTPTDRVITACPVITILLPKRHQDNTTPEKLKWPIVCLPITLSPLLISAYVYNTRVIIDTARIVCGRVYVTVRCPSGCLSHSSYRLSIPMRYLQRAADRRYLSIAAASDGTHQHSTQQQMRAVSCCQLT